MLVSVLRTWARPRQVQFNRPLRDTPESQVLGYWANELSMKVAEPWRPAHAAFRSYDANSGKYLGRDGRRHACP